MRTMILGKNRLDLLALFYPKFIATASRHRGFLLKPVNRNTMCCGVIAKNFG